MLKTIRKITSRPFAAPGALLRDERGLSTVEYVILLVLIAAACVGLWSTFGKTISSKLKASDKTMNDNLHVEE
jgi:Flp pilus assembly pilin Flp